MRVIWLLLILLASIQPHDIGFKTLISATEWPKGVAQIEKHVCPSRCC
jgi:hypothetical protein